MQVDVVNSKGAKTGRTVDLPDDIFAIEPNDHCIYLAVKQYQAANRQGTHKTKTRAEVHGSSKKLHRQKGTGGSRKGNIRNPLYKGGGTIFGPKPHKYEIKLNRKVKDLAKMSALTYKAKENAIFIIEDVNLEVPKTKTFATMLNDLKVTDKKIMFITPDYNDNVYVSSRNIPSVLTTLLSDVNTYDLVNSEAIVLTESAALIFGGTEEDDAKA